MGRYDYGRVRSRRGGGIWQWMIIGMVLGFSCAAIFVLAALTLGYLAIDTEGRAMAGRPTQTPLVITATLDPNAPTTAPIIVTATPDTAGTQSAIETQQADQSISAPTATLAPSDTLTPDPAIEGQVQTAPTTDPNAAGTAPTPTTSMVGGTSGVPSAVVPGQVPEQLAGLISPLVPVEGGSFEMGTTPNELVAAERLCIDQGGQCTVAMGEDTLPVRVTTVNPFQIERTEVTYGQYIAFLNYLKQTGMDHRNGCGTPTAPRVCALTRNEEPNSNILYDSANYTLALAAQEPLPVANVTWDGADTYCRTIGRRLPTEAEWERAARGPNNYLYPWGNDFDPTRANVGGVETSLNAPVAVTEFVTGAGSGGVLNMAGNAAEWVADWYNEDYYSDPNSTVNPTGPALGIEKVIRGGSWADRAFFARAVHRRNEKPDLNFVSVGFRCAADANTSATTNSGSAIDTSGSGQLPPISGTLDPQEFGRIDDPNSSPSAPTLPPLATLSP